jgi:hypothetical protein
MRWFSLLCSSGKYREEAGETREKERNGYRLSVADAVESKAVVRQAVSSHGEGAGEKGGKACRAR